MTVGALVWPEVHWTNFPLTGPTAAEAYRAEDDGRHNQEAQPHPQANNHLVGEPDSRHSGCVLKVHEMGQWVAVCLLLTNA